MQGRIMVGMSGGVDSAVAAYLLAQQGHDVIGVFMKNWEETDEDGVCSAQEDYDDVRRTCDTIGIPYYTVNFSRQYRDRVFSVFLHEYECGRTPNPDVLCNSEIKFNAFLDFAMQTECLYLATGHYARRLDTADGCLLLKGKDPQKDQSYFLCGLRQEMLQKAMFPIGEIPKTEVREIARKANLPVAEKKDSTGICFIGERRFRSFISQYITGHQGKIVDADTGEVLGTHEGLYLYTIGQRRGLGIGGHGTGERWFVIEKDAQTDTLYVVQGEHNPRRYHWGLYTEGFSWILGKAPATSFDCTVRYRYRQKEIPCHVECTERGLWVQFQQPQAGIAPGQYAVLYQGEVCLGGGVITSAAEQGPDYTEKGHI